MTSDAAAAIAGMDMSGQVSYAEQKIAMTHPWRARRPAEAAAWQRFEFSWPASGADWAAFAAHVKGSAERFLGTTRTAQGTVADLEAVVSGWAAKVAASPPGEPVTCQVRLGAADRAVFRRFLEASRNRANAEGAHGPESGVQAALDAWDRAVQTNLRAVDDDRFRWRDEVPARTGGRR